MSAVNVKRARAQQVAQVVRAGRGWLVTRNSATLASSDYENVAREIADALKKRNAYPLAIRAAQRALAALHALGYENVQGARDAEAILRELGEVL